MRQPRVRRLTVAVAASLTLAGCGGGDGDEPAANDGLATSPTEAEDSSSEAAADVPDACSLLDVEEISAAIGREVGPGEPQPTAEVGSSCRFETLTGMSTSTTYDDPVVPETAPGSVTISTARSSAEEFDEFEALVGDEAEAVSGIGDDAHFWGENIIYVRVADRGLTVRIEADDADTAAVRAAVLQLAELGASKL